MVTESATLTRRERRRAETIREILDAAEAQIAQVGVHGLSLRGVARELDMTAQALYNYFGSRDELVTALVANAHDSLADAVEHARTHSAGRNAAEVLLDVTRAYRTWALENPHRFGLAYGMPLVDYVAPADGPTTVGPRRMGAVFAGAMFTDWTREQLTDLRLPNTGTSTPVADTGALGDLPPAAGELLLIAWARLHGLVTLEVFGHLGQLTDPESLFETAMRTLLADLDRLRDTAAR